MATKKASLATIAEQITKMDARMERSFAAVAEDVAKLATKEQIIALHTQVNSIETELRDSKRHKLVTRVADLEEKVFGKTRA